MNEFKDTIFENRESDWLAEERKRERKMSVWESFDDDSAKAERLRHEEDCEREEVARQHADSHERYARANNIPYNTPASQTIRSVRKATTKAASSGAPKAAILITVGVVIMIALGFITFAFTILGEFSGMPLFFRGRYILQQIMSTVFPLVFFFIFISIIVTIIRAANGSARK